MYGEMKVLDVRNWVLNNQSSEKDVWFADMLKDEFSTGMKGWTNRSLNGAWLKTWEVEKLFTFFLVDGEYKFKAMECEVSTYFKDNPAIEPSMF